MKRFLQFKKDTRGVALIYVIVTASVLLLLGAATTSVAYANLKMTQIQKEADNNFYSADSVLNAMVGGLAEIASIAYEEAYTDVVSTITEYDNVAAMRARFEELYTNSLNELLKDETNVDASEIYNRYSVSRLRSCAEQTYSEDYSYFIDASGGENYMDELQSEDGKRSLVLRNVHIVYQDDSGYYDEITTDIKMEVPDVGLKMLPPNPDYFNTLLIAGNGVVVEGGTAVNLYGDMYVRVDDDDTTMIENALEVKGNASVGVYPTHEAVLAGPIKTNMMSTIKFNNWEASDGVIDAPQSYLWTEDLQLGKRSITDLTGNIFVYDDLEVNGSHSSVNLTGSYYGFSKETGSASDSSSISINGAHTELNMSGLENLILGGASYIKTSLVEGREANSSDIQMGEALALKSNQIAYLVDPREFAEATDPSTDLKNFVANPMSYAQYDAMIAADEWSTVANRIKYRELSTGFSYNDFCRNGRVDIVKVFSALNGGTVYIYVQYQSPLDAANYFNALMQSDSETAMRLRAYSEQYLSKFTINKDTQLLLNANYVSTNYEEYAGAQTTNGGTPIQTIIPIDESAQSGLGYGFVSSDNPTEYKQIIANILEQANSRYIGDGTNGLKNKATFDDIINRDNLRAFIQNATIASGSYVDHNTDIEISKVRQEGVGDGAIIRGSTEATAVIVDNEGKNPYRLSSGTGLVIATGDIIVEGSWIGGIIAGGTVTFNTGSSINPTTVQYDQAMVSTVLYLYFRHGDPLETMAVINIYKGFENYEVAEAAQERSDREDMIKNCITYHNWTKG